MWLWILATVLAYFIKGLCGFANTLVFTSIVGFGASNVSISPVELVLGYPANFILTWKNRSKLSAKVFIPLASLVLLGCIPGALLLSNVNARAIKIVFGVVVVFVACEMFCRERNWINIKESKVFLILIGILSGVLCGLFGVGVLLAAYVNRVSKSSDEFKANMSAVFIIENTFRIIMYVILGVITLSSLKYAAFLLPFELIGLFLGMKSSQFLNEKTIKQIVIVLLAISGLALILTNI